MELTPEEPRKIVVAYAGMGLSSFEEYEDADSWYMDEDGLHICKGKTVVGTHARGGWTSVRFA